MLQARQPVLRFLDCPQVGVERVLEQGQVKPLCAQPLLMCHAPGVSSRGRRVLAGRETCPDDGARAAGPPLTLLPTRTVKSDVKKYRGGT